MEFNQEEIDFININRPIIQGILEKKLEDIFDDILYNKDEEKVKVLRVWAREVRELINVLDNFRKLKPKSKKKKNDTGI